MKNCSFDHFWCLKEHVLLDLLHHECHELSDWNLAHIKCANTLTLKYKTKMILRWSSIKHLQNVNIFVHCVIPLTSEAAAASTSSTVTGIADFGAEWESAHDNAPSPTSQTIMTFISAPANKNVWLICSLTFQCEAEKVRTGIDREAPLSLVSSPLLLHPRLQHSTEVLRHLIEEREKAPHGCAQHHLLVELKTVGSPFLTIPVQKWAIEKH